jgi:hypothetical protein
MDHIDAQDAKARLNTSRTANMPNLTRRIAEGKAALARQAAEAERIARINTDAATGVSHEPYGASVEPEHMAAVRPTAGLPRDVGDNGPLVQEPDNSIGSGEVAGFELWDFNR